MRRRKRFGIVIPSAVILLKDLFVNPLLWWGDVGRGGVDGQDGRGFAVDFDF